MGLGCFRWFGWLVGRGRGLCLFCWCGFCEEEMGRWRDGRYRLEERCWSRSGGRLCLLELVWLVVL